MQCGVVRKSALECPRDVGLLCRLELDMCLYKNAVIYLSRQSHLGMVRMSREVIPFYLEISFPRLIYVDRVR